LSRSNSRSQQRASNIGFALGAKALNNLTMTNVIKFPRNRGPISDPVSDLGTVELALMRTRLELTHVELDYAKRVNRRQQAEWAWHCCKRLLFWAAMIWLLHAMLASGAKAESSTSRSFYNERGSFAGSSISRGNSTSFYGSNGSFAGSAIRHGNSTSFYDGRGHFTGSSINTGPRR
jgi:hypothetical protein